MTWDVDPAMTPDADTPQGPVVVRQGWPLAEELLWEGVQEIAPWEFVLRKAGLTQTGYDDWLHRSTGAKCTVVGAGGFGSYLMFDGAEEFEWTIDKVIVDWLYRGDPGEAGRALARMVLASGAGAEDSGVPPRLVSGVRKRWEAAGIAWAVVEAATRAPEAAREPAATESVLELSPEVRRLTAEKPGPRDDAQLRHDVASVEQARTIGKSSRPVGCPPLDGVRDLLCRYLVLPEAWQYEVLAVWAAHTHLIEAFDVTPRLYVTSPEPGSGKTRVLDLLGLVTCNPRQTVNLSQASLFRRIDQAKGAVTVLLDEVDTVFGARGAGDAEQIKAVLNGGYRRGATVLRAGIQKRGFPTETFDVFAPVAMAGLGGVPTYAPVPCVVINMRKRRADEPMQLYRRREVAAEAAQLHQQLEQWAASVRHDMPEPDLPDALTDRDVEIWEPLLSVAQAAGPEWAAAIRVAAVAAVAAVQDGANSAESPQTNLLRAVKDVFDDRGEDRLPTEALLKGLEDHEAVGREYLTAQSLASTLSKYSVSPKAFPQGKKVKRGYLRSDFEDPWSRYLA